MQDRIDIRGGGNERRRFLGALASGAVLALSGCSPGPSAGPGEKERESGDQEEGVSTVEDLMREHGVLRRILLVYGEALRRFEANEEMPAQALMDSAQIIRSFIEEYHEKLEEEFLFPRFLKANGMVELVDVLAKQHKGGRGLTEVTLQLATPEALQDPQERGNLADSLRRFIRMYSPHAAREDTVLFPAFHEIVTPKEYDELGERFEEREHELFGEGGFEAMVERVAAIEKSMGIYELAQFTPKE